MEQVTQAEFVLTSLIDMWAVRLSHLSEYLETQFAYFLDRSYEPARLFIAQMADGDLATDNIGHLFSAKWVLLGRSLQQVSLDYAYNEMYDKDLSGDLYVSPSWLYWCEGNGVLLSERYGTSLIHRLQGHIRGFGSSRVIEWTTLWRSGKGGIIKEE